MYYSLVYSYQTYALLAWRRSVHTNSAKIECAHMRARKSLTDYNHKILTFHSINYFALLKAFNTNTLNFHQYFKDKLSSHQPSHMHNNMQTQYKQSYYYYTFSSLKTDFFYLYQVIPIWNRLPSSFKNCTFKFTFKKLIESHLLASQY